MLPANRQPNLFLVGAPKCATTSMDFYLSQHPEIFMAGQKESHMFALDLYPPGTQCNWTRYCGFFDGVAGQAVRGESSVFYMLSRTAPRAIAEFAPDARILVMLRNPLDVVASHHSQLLYEGLESESDLATALALEADRKAACPPERAIYRDRVLHYRDVVAFGAQLARLRQAFPAEQIQTVIFDDLVAHPAREYARVLAFLGVDPAFVPAFTRENANKTVRSTRLRDFLSATPQLVTRVGRLALPDPRLRRRVRGALKRLNTNHHDRPAMAPSLRRELARELRPDIEHLSGLLQRDLTPWLDDRAPAPPPGGVPAGRPAGPGLRQAGGAERARLAAGA